MRTTAAVIVAAALVLVVALGVEPRVSPPSGDSEPVVQMPAEGRVPVEIWQGISPEALPGQRLRPDSSGHAGESGGSAEDGVGVRCGEELQASARTLLATLAAEAEQAPDDVHEVAAALMGEWLEQAQVGPCPPEAWSEALVAALDQGAWDEIVRGASLALLSALGAEEAVARRHPGRGEAWRGAVLGRAWRLGLAADEASGLVLDVGAFLEGRLVGRLPALPLELVRVPSTAARAGLEWALVSTARDWDEQLDREVALLVLATGLDRDPALLQVYAGLLASPAESARQVLEVVVFCLQRSRRPAARHALQDFAAQALHQRDPARWLQSRLQLWLANLDQGRPDLGETLARLADPAVGRLPRLTALASLDAWQQRLDDEQRRQAEEQLALLLDQEADGVVVSMALSLLGEWPGGGARLASLDRVLRSSANPQHRLQAARGLASTPAPRRGEALALLRRHRPDEEDEGVLAVIDEALE